MNKMTGKELVAFCRSKKGTAYVYGAKGEVMTADRFDVLRKLYSQYVPLSDRAKVGKVCVDCSGLISWATNRTLNSAGWRAAADEVHPIATLGTAPVGALVWMKGHIGVYTGKNKDGVCCYIAADGSKHGVREVTIDKNSFTHWLLVRDVFTYEMEDEEMVEKDTIIVNGKKHLVDMIRKDGVTYVKTRDFAEIAGYQVSNQGKTPVLVKE